jgi:hypothetical protein
LRYDVVVVGFRLNASLKPAQALQLVLGMDAETSKDLTRRFPASVLSGISLSQAERVSEALTDAGAKVEVRESRLSLAAEGVAGTSSPPVTAELSDGTRRAPRAEHDAASGNYEIGEILAPLGKRGASPPPSAAPAETPVTKRASREELDQALRDSLHPDAAPARAAAPAPAARPATAAPDTFELMDNSAFAGLQSFGSELDGFGDEEAPKVQVDEVALRSIQRRPDNHSADKAPGPPSIAARLRPWLSNFSAVAFDWGTALLSLLVVTGITLLAVGYALDPDNVLGAIGLGTLPVGAKKLFGDMFGK